MKSIGKPIKILGIISARSNSSKELLASIPIFERYEDSNITILKEKIEMIGVAKR
tara:strand:- start:32 stop:196 length:165 start_codon:yes stop_codon:yes gene_type:complete